MKGWGFAAAGCLLLSPGCGSVRDLARLPLAEPGFASVPAPRDSRDPWNRERPEALLRLGVEQDRYSLALWAWRPRSDSDGHAGGNEALGARFEWTRFESGAESGRLGTSGVLVEAVGGMSTSGDRDETRAFEGGAWWTTGSVTGVRGDPFGELPGFDLRSDFLVGIRFVSVRERDDDTGGLLDGDRDHYAAPELSVGWRLEYSPVQGAVLFGRVDLGVFAFAGSFEWVGGIRLEPSRSVGVEVGWRGLASAGGQLFDSLSFSWTGPWAGVVISF